MTYNLYIYNKRMKIYEKKGEYKTKQIAETKASAFVDKGREYKITIMPEKKDLVVGFKVYLLDGELYGEIIDEGGSFYYIRRSFKDENDSAFFLEDSFMDKYENGIFIMKESD